MPVPPDPAPFDAFGRVSQAAAEIRSLLTELLTLLWRLPIALLKLLWYVIIAILTVLWNLITAARILLSRSKTTLNAVSIVTIIVVLGAIAEFTGVTLSDVWQWIQRPAPVSIDSTSIPTTTIQTKGVSLPTRIALPPTQTIPPKETCSEERSIQHGRSATYFNGDLNIAYVAWDIGGSPSRQRIYLNLSSVPPNENPISTGELQAGQTYRYTANKEYVITVLSPDSSVAIVRVNKASVPC